MVVDGRQLVVNSYFWLRPFLCKRMRSHSTSTVTSPIFEVGALLSFLAGHYQDQPFLLFRYIAVVFNRCMCCGNVVEGRIELFIGLQTSQWGGGVTRRSLEKVIAQGALSKVVF